MNKATKGAIAAGAAGILLLGGAGTFAVWEDTKSIAGRTISTGELSLDVHSGTWTETAAPDTAIDTASFEIVPGDSLTYTTAVTVTATGDNLTGELKIVGGSLVKANGLPAEHVSASVTHTAVDGGGLDVGAAPNTNVMTFVESGTPYTFDVKITVAFSADAIELDDQNLDLTLSSLALTLEQK